jgi:hypothetical protein
MRGGTVNMEALLFASGFLTLLLVLVALAGKEIK